MKSRITPNIVWDMKTGNFYERKGTDMTTQPAAQKALEIAILAAEHSIFEGEEWPSLRSCYLKELIASAKRDLAAEQEEKWPKQNDEYYTLFADGEVKPSYWNGGCIDLGRMTQSNVFRTHAAAEQKAENDRTIKMLTDEAGWAPDWNSESQEKWFPVISHKASAIEWYAARHHQYWPYAHFRTKAEGQAAVDAIGIDRVKQLFLTK